MVIFLPQISGREGVDSAASKMSLFIPGQLISEISKFQESISSTCKFSEIEIVI